MKKYLAIFSAAVLLAATMGPAMARGTAHGTDVDVEFDNNYFQAVYSGDDSFTFITNGPYPAEQIPEWSDIESIFAVYAHPGRALTGNVSFTVRGQYQLDAPGPVDPHTGAQVGDYTGDYSANMFVRLDVLLPQCPYTCSPMGAEYLGGTRVDWHDELTEPGGGVWNFSSPPTGATGTYDYLQAVLFEYYNLYPRAGFMGITSISFSFDTVAVAIPEPATMPSPVPELPPFAMMGAGLAALGLCARFKGRRKKAPAALSA